MTGKRIEIKGDPIPLQRPRGTRNGFYDPQHIAKKNFAWAVKLQYSDQPLDRPLKVSFYFHFKIPESWSKKKKTLMLHKAHSQRPDNSNLVKFVEDALNEVVWLDDAIISKIVAEKKWEEEAKTIIEIEDDI